MFFVLFLLTIELWSAPADDYLIRVKTDNPGVSADNEFTVPITRTRGNGYNVDCDDDGTDEGIAITGNNSYTCVYASAGTYTVRVKDNNGDNEGFRRIRFYVDSTTETDVLKLLEIKQWGSARWSSMVKAYRGAVNLTVTPIDVPDLSQLSSIRQMFHSCSQALINTANWDTSTITNMSEIFRGASVADPDVSSWDTSSVTNMAGMFQDAAAAEPVVSPSGVIWDTSNVTRMRNMFRGASTADPDVGSWDTSSVTDISSMFRDAGTFDRDISNWNISNVENAKNFLLGGALSQANYDALLSSWGTQTVQSSVDFNGGTSQYCSGKDGRDLLLAESWTITDGGENCGGVCASAVGALSENQWTTISFPCSTGTNGIEALIGTAVVGSYGNSGAWVVYEQRGDYSGSGASMVALAATDPVEPGKGYWIIADHNTTWHIDGSLSELSYAPTVTASSLGISTPAFDYVHLRDLPDSATDQQKVLLGNPFPHDIQIADTYFSHAGGTFEPMDGNANNDPYVNDVVYVYESGDYKAISAGTPGFDKVIHQQGFWLRLKPGQSGTNRITYPKAK